MVLPHIPESPDDSDPETSLNRGEIPDEGRTGTGSREHTFYASMRTWRIFSGVAGGIFAIAFGAYLALVGQVLDAIFFFVFGFLLLLYGVALGLGWIEMGLLW